jgi:hypothetical protein
MPMLKANAQLRQCLRGAKKKLGDQEASHVGRLDWLEFL